MAKLNRRDLLKLGVLAGGGALLGDRASQWLQAKGQEAVRLGEYPLMDPENQIYTVCLQCNTGCPIKVKLFEGVAAKIDGNPAAPWTLYPHLRHGAGGSRAGGRGLVPQGTSGYPDRVRPVPHP